MKKISILAIVMLASVMSYAQHQVNSFFDDMGIVRLETQKYNGTVVEIIRPLTDTECDIEDVGNMYKARFFDGYERDVFEDELFKK